MATRKHKKTGGGETLSAWTRAAEAWLEEHESDCVLDENGVEQFDWGVPPAPDSSVAKRLAKASQHLARSAFDAKLDEKPALRLAHALQAGSVRGKEGLADCEVLVDQLRLRTEQKHTQRTPESHAQERDNDAVQQRQHARQQKILEVVQKLRKPSRSIAALLISMRDAGEPTSRDTLRRDLHAMVKAGMVTKEELPPLGSPQHE